MDVVIVALRLRELGGIAGLGHMRAKEAMEDLKTGTIRVANAVFVWSGGGSSPLI